MTDNVVGNYTTNDYHNGLSSRHIDTLETKFRFVIIFWEIFTKSEFSLEKVNVSAQMFLFLFFLMIYLFSHFEVS